METNTRCRGCDAPIYWIKTQAGKSHPLNPTPEKRWVEYWPDGNPDLKTWQLIDTYTSHFATCPAADQFRKKKTLDPDLSG